jgi:hypothetical protein
MVTNTAAKLAAAIALCIGLAGAVVAQTSPPPGPTAPEGSLPVPKAGENLVLNPTRDECKAGWRPGLKWTKKQFDQFCRQMEISK